MDFEKCLSCELPLNYCDGLTRYKCGKETKNVEKYCAMEKRKSL